MVFFSGKNTNVPMYPRLFLVFSSIRFSVSSFLLISLIHLDLGRVINTDLFAFFFMQTSSSASTVCWWDCFPLYGFGFFVKNQVFKDMLVNFWVFGLIPLMNLSVSAPVLCSFDHYCYVVQLEIKECNSSRSFFIFQDCFSCPVFCLFVLCEVGNFFFKFCTNFIASLMGIALNL